MPLSFTLLLRLKRCHSCDQWHSSRLSTFLTGSHCKYHPNTKGQYVWPATGSDGGSNKAPGGLYGGVDKNVAPGALLAIPAGPIAASVHVTTVVGAKIKQALIDYGAYIVDDTGGGNSVAVCMEADVNEEMRRAYGYAMTYPHGVSSSPSDLGNALYADLLAIFRALHAVTNNGPTAVGGGGTPRVPVKAPICGAPQ
jgi:hypothetical protein